MRDEGLKSKGRSQKSKIKSLILKICVNLWPTKRMKDEAISPFVLFASFVVSLFVLRALRVLRGSKITAHYSPQLLVLLAWDRC
ncbi:hypothetical protein JOD20_000889 [Herpetosiphon giganteus]|nr:hypothetical protein [Herpetosiphon giganteus]